MHSNVWDEITYPFPNFNSYTVEVWERISNSIPHITMDELFILGLKLWEENRQLNGPQLL